MMNKQHAEKCTSHEHKYYGDRRTMPDGDEMLECNCDGSHTFDELYEHRMTLFITLCRYIKLYESLPQVWRSHKHADGSIFDGGFLLGINKEGGYQISYHLPLDRWEETNFAATLDNAPEWDGHTPADVLERLKAL